MDSNQKPSASTPIETPADRPVYSPPSLVEPAEPTTGLPEPAQPTVSEKQAVALPDLGQPPTSAENSPATIEAEMPEGGFYRAGTTEEESSVADEAPGQSRTDIPVVEWTSSGESFQVHSDNWRLRMGIFTLVGAVLVFLITRSYFSTGAIVVAGMLFAVLGSRQPRPVSYRLDDRGIQVGRKQFFYAQFRAFSVPETTPTINLVPLKRFSPVMVLRYDPSIVKDIIEALSRHLPMEETKGNAVDGIVRRLKI